MRNFRPLLFLGIYALTYCCIVDKKLSPDALSMRNVAIARAAISDFIVTRFVRDMRQTIDQMVASKGTTRTPGDGKKAGYLAAQMTKIDSRHKRTEWRSRMKDMLNQKNRKIIQSENLIKKLAPTVDAILDKDPSPLIIFINRKSGGQTGAALLERLQPNFPSAQVCDLSEHSAADYLSLYSNCSNLRILICGGDGTVGWIMDETRKACPNKEYSFGIVPLGTGNDLCLQLRDIPMRSSDHEEHHYPVGVEDSPSEFHFREHSKSINTGEEHSLQGDILNHRNPSEASREDRIVTNLFPSMVIADPKKLKEWFKSPQVVQLDRWQINVQRVHGRKRKLLKLLLIQNKVKRRGNSIVSRVSGLLSRLWGFGKKKTKRNKDILHADSFEESVLKNVPHEESSVGKFDMVNNISVKKSLKKKKSDMVKNKEAMNFTMNNYLGIGVDGAVTLGFHTLRQKVPALFFSRWVNKMWYGMIGVRTLLSGWSRDLSACCQLICDGKVVKIPPGTQSIIILNINSYAGGMKMWPDATSLYHLGNSNSVSSIPLIVFIEI